MNEELAINAMVDQLVTLANNEMTSRLSFLQKFFDKRRDIDAECGYPVDVTPEEYYRFYRRFSIARRVVQVMPFECWQVVPEVYEREKSKADTPFDEAWKAMGAGLNGRSYHNQDGKTSPVFEYLRRLDVLSGIGGYGVMLFGIDDGKELRTPAFDTGFEDSAGPMVTQFTGDTSLVPRKLKEPKPKKDRKLLFLRVFPEALCQITQYENNPANPRYGQPVMYSITMNDPRESRGGIGLTTSTMQVHWTRVLHLADNLDSSEVFGTPRMEPVWNHLLDLYKLYGGSAEMYWLGAFMGLAFETHPQLGGDVKIDMPKMKDAYEQWRNGLQRAFFLMGQSVKAIAPTVVAPTEQINAHMEAVAIILNMPMRILKGSERGEQASSQDDSNWNDRTQERRDNHISPRELVPFVDRCILLGVLPEPKNGWRYKWPDATSMSAAEKATVANTKTQALSSYVSSGAESLITPMDYLTRFLDFSEDEANAMLGSAAAAVEEPEHDTSSPLLGLVGGIGAMLQMFTSFQQGAMSEETLKQLIMLFYKVDEAKATAIIADGLPTPPHPALPPVPAMGKGGGGKPQPRFQAPPSPPSAFNPVAGVPEA